MRRLARTCAALPTAISGRRSRFRGETRLRSGRDSSLPIIITQIVDAPASSPSREFSSNLDETQLKRPPLDSPPSISPSNQIVQNKVLSAVSIPPSVPLRSGIYCGAILVAVVFLVPTLRNDKHGVSDDRATSVLYGALSDIREMLQDLARSIGSIFDSLLDSLWTILANAYQCTITLGILAQCVNAVLFSKGEDYANEVVLRWRLIVISLLADLAGASHARRIALVHAGNGAVVDWLLESIVNGEVLIQAEASRAISHFLSDAETCDDLLARPNALSYLLLFTASVQPKNKVNEDRKLGFDETDHKTRGRSMLVTTLMDIVTSSCENNNVQRLKPRLSRNADSKDIRAALRVLQEGGLHFDDNQEDNSGCNDDRGGLHELSKKIPEAINTEAVLSPISPHGLAHLILSWLGHNQLFQCSSPLDRYEAVDRGHMKRESVDSHGLWDDLQGRYMAVPLAAWAVATWAEASAGNCAKMAEIDKHGDAIMAAVMAPERTVKWHGAIAAHHILAAGFDNPAVTWSDGLLKAAIQASDAEDENLSLVTLNSFLTCLTKNGGAREVVVENRLPSLRNLVRQTSKVLSLQKVIVNVAEILFTDIAKLPQDEGKKWSSILLRWIFNHSLEVKTRGLASEVLARLLDGPGNEGMIISLAWLAMLNLEVVNAAKSNSGKDIVSTKAKSKGITQNQASQSATQAVNELAKVVWNLVGESQGYGITELPWGDFSMLEVFQKLVKDSKKDAKAKVMPVDAVTATKKALKMLAELAAEESGHRLRVIEAGGLHVLRKLMLMENGFEKAEASEALTIPNESSPKTQLEAQGLQVASSVCRHAARLLSILSLHASVSAYLKRDIIWCKWLEDSTDDRILGCSDDLKLRSYARTTLLNLASFMNNLAECEPRMQGLRTEGMPQDGLVFPRYEDKLFLFNTESLYWKLSLAQQSLDLVSEPADVEIHVSGGNESAYCKGQEQVTTGNFDMDVVFVHGLCGGPFKTWRIADDKASATGKAGLVEKIDVESGREGTSWPKQWLQSDLPACRLMTVKYKTNFSQWSGATLPLQEVSAMMLDKLLASGVGDRPVVFVTHSMGGLVVKQMLMQACQDQSRSKFVKKAVGIVFYSCPHFGSKLADMPWRFGLVLRPAPSVGELRSGSARLEELNQLIRNLHKGGLRVLSFSETKVTPLVEGYGGWALRMEVVPIESAYPGFGELVVLNGTDHVNSCKPISRDDAAYVETLLFLQKLAKAVKEDHGVH